MEAEQNSVLLIRSQKNSNNEGIYLLVACSESSGFPRASYRCLDCRSRREFVHRDTKLRTAVYEVLWISKKEVSGEEDQSDAATSDTSHTRPDSMVAKAGPRTLLHASLEKDHALTS